MSGAEFSRYARNLSRAAATMAGAGSVVAATVGRGALRSAQANAPVETGRLRGEMRLVRRGETSIVESPTRYAQYVEYGTSVNAPEPYVYPAFVEWGGRLVSEVEKVRDEAIRQL